jgi:hypothetical protein
LERGFVLGGAVDFPGGGSGEEDLGLGGEVGFEMEAIAADHAACCMEHDHLTGAVRAREGALDLIGGDGLTMLKFRLILTPSKLQVKAALPGRLGLV